MAHYYFVYDDVDFGVAPYNVSVLDFDVPILGEPRISTRRIAAATGVIARGFNRDSVVITLQCGCEFADVDNPDTTLDAIAAALSTIEQVSLTLSWEPWKSWTVLLQSGVSFERLAGGALFTLSFLVPSGTYEEVGT